jgi:hypothetical protein
MRQAKLDCFVAGPVIARAFARSVGSSQWRIQPVEKPVDGLWKTC